MANTPTPAGTTFPVRLAPTPPAVADAVGNLISACQSWPKTNMVIGDLDKVNDASLLCKAAENGFFNAVQPAIADGRMEGFGAAFALLFVYVVAARAFRGIRNYVRVQRAISAQSRPS